MRANPLRGALPWSPLIAPRAPRCRSSPGAKVLLVLASGRAQPVWCRGAGHAAINGFVQFRCAIHSPLSICPRLKTLLKKPHTSPCEPLTESSGHATHRKGTACEQHEQTAKAARHAPRRGKVERRGRGNTGHRARAHARHTGMPRVRARRGPSRCCTVYGDAPQAAPAVGWLEAGALCVSSTEYGCGVRMRRRAHDTHARKAQGKITAPFGGACGRRTSFPILFARSEASRTYARRALRDDGKHGL